MKVAQPRRIAASTLMKRMRSTLGRKVGLRMGHGVRDEYPETLITIATTGHMLKMAAFRPEYFRDHTHLIIDEVHERSLDSDLMCLLAKRLLDMYPMLRLVLMSATLHAQLYQSYFEAYNRTGVPVLYVGARRFPVSVHYLEDLPSKFRCLADRVRSPRNQGSSAVRYYSSCCESQSTGQHAIKIREGSPNVSLWHRLRAIIFCE